MNISKESNIGTIVAEDYRSAGIFEQFGIDFCCNGNRSIQAACDEKNIASETVVNALSDLFNAATSGTASIDYKSWPIDLLADYVEKKHHRYVATQIPVIQSFLTKIVNAHGAKHPELAEIKALFEDSAEELTAHMQKEEQILFPFVRKMIAEKQAGNKSVATPFGTVQNPIKVMMNEHDTEGERFRKIKELSNNYTAPQDGCNTYRAAFANLQAFEDDLHLHIHLENNILFPKAIQLEASLN